MLSGPAAKSKRSQRYLTPGYYTQKNFLAAGPRKHCEGPTHTRISARVQPRTRLQATYISETKDTGTAGARGVFTQP